MLKASTLFLVSALFALSGTVVHAQCVPLPDNECVVLTPSKDATLYQDDAGALSNGGGTALFIGRIKETEGGLLRRALLAFDLSSIPDGARVNSVEVSLWINRAPFVGALPGIAKLHRVKSDWGEGTTVAPGLEGEGAPAQAGDTTWQHRFYDSETWTAAGGDFVSVPSATAVFGASREIPLDFDSTEQLVTDVRAWLADPEFNFGWILIGDEVTMPNGRRLSSREDSIGPVPTLTVHYDFPSVLDNLELEMVVDGLSQPVGVAHASDGTSRLFIVEQAGIIRILNLETGIINPEPFLDIQDQVNSTDTEQGLLGLAFHPDYSNNGRFFVNATVGTPGTAGFTEIIEYQVTEDPDVADDSPFVILRFEQEARNHNAGDIHFGSDGYLYISSGDGGGRDDQYDHGQNINSLLGAMLRIDVDGTPAGGAEICGLTANYGIPEGNAFPGQSDGCDEILHFGLRNPWRFSFDAMTQDLWIGDVGQNRWEEVNQLAPDSSGVNLGWSCREGTQPFDGTPCISSYTDPVIEYPNGADCAVTGGYVYRGSHLPLNGHYVYGDYCSAKVWVASNETGTWVPELWETPASMIDFLSSFGQDESCNLYLVDRGSASDDGALYLITDTEWVFGGGFEPQLCR